MLHIGVKANPSLFYRSYLFITYEVEYLDKAVTIDTHAILQEKYKSYIYLRATPSNEQDNLAAGMFLEFCCFYVSIICDHKQYCTVTSAWFYSSIIAVHLLLVSAILAITK